MRKALVLAGLLVVLVLATYGGSASMAQTTPYCSVPCASGHKLECSTVSGTCSANSGILTCCGQQYNCAAINAYSACRSACFADYNACKAGCPDRECMADCTDALLPCHESCGPRPQTSFSC